MRASEAVEAVQSFIDDALMVGVGSVTILHGKGTGALKEEIRRYLRTVPDIAGVADEYADRGGAGITVVTFGERMSRADRMPTAERPYGRLRRTEREKRRKDELYVKRNSPYLRGNLHR